MERKLGFIFDHNKCIICNACVDACNKAYGDLNWRSLIVMTHGESKTALSIACNHCDNPTCMQVCPANAIEKNEMGIVRIRDDKCIGCGFCTWACPYEALKFNNEGVMSKCHFCYDRLAEGKGIPYCVEACPTGALAFGWIEKGEAEVNYLPPSEITKPRIVIKQPESKETLNASVLHTKKEENYLGLLAFTIGSEFALGYSLFKLPLWSIVSVILLVASLLLSVNHARKTDRFYRVIYNLKTSWLSREVLFSSIAILFYILSIAEPLFYYPAILFLTVGVISSIMIYMLKSRPSWYNVDTPVSFIGSIFTMSLPIVYFFSHNLTTIIPLIITLVIEIISNNRRSNVRMSLNVASIVISLISIVFPEIIIITEIINIVSEVTHRREFYEKVVYYGLPKV
ncbi:4Fe-4S dicluster domain-containing protein [Saccharolobus solfataricus]|nr:4Fe-4S dicluster domain-containing protein [Saccharolobus solfataricus]AKA72961.2 4Fe-4S dicluster domain-containing protein [Saccharolobus solfataricus]AKA75660.1 4Fe-4S dicluster domain-containing protein [Saccharolobus solfataricus]AKA78353.1 4Fe-4S dicluster domain-containing protein [Saccharolobus solfataricus]AZF67472.1 4Fe-4S dicluster domain-containing protein [Saccharolobus solfataricus]AZF70092.1 4Fe-4S dicluster domain-containing protein [Saccharolobus solfataricus]